MPISSPKRRPPCATGQRAAHHARTSAAQAGSALPMGRFDSPHLRGVPAAMPNVWRPDAHQSRSSRKVPTSGKYSNPLGQILNHHKSRQHVVLLCGMTVTRRWAKVMAASQIGPWRRNPFQTTRWTSSSIGDSVMQWFRQLRGAVACAPDLNPSCILRSRHKAAASAQTA